MRQPSRYVLALASVLMLAPATALTLASPAVASDKVYEAAVVQVTPTSATVGSPLTAKIEVTNLSDVQSIGSIKVSAPDSLVGAGFSLGSNWTVTGCSGNPADGVSCGGTWSVTTVASNTFLLAANVNGQNAISANGGYLDIVLAGTTLGTTATGGNAAGDFGIVVKQSNAFNDGGSANQFSGTSSVTATYAFTPSSACASSKVCGLDGVTGSLSSTDVTGGSSGATTIAWSTESNACGASARDSVMAVVTTSATKTVNLTWSTAFTSEQLSLGIKSKQWPVCMQAPYPLFDAAANSVISPDASGSGLVQALLPNCSRKVAAYPCVQDRGLTAVGAQYALVNVPDPGNNLDPKFF